MVHGVLPLEPVSVCHPRNRRGGRSALSAVPSAGVAPRVVGGVAHGAQYAACGELVALVASLSGGSHGESVGQRGQRESSPCVPTAWSRPVTVTARPLQGCGMPAGYVAALRGRLLLGVECARNHEERGLRPLPVGGSRSQSGPAQPSSLTGNFCIEGEFEPYHVIIPGASGSPVAAAAKAAHDVLVSLFQAQTASLDTTYHNYLAAQGLLETDPGVAVGEQAAAGILALRANDGRFPPNPPPFL